MEAEEVRTVSALLSLLKFGCEGKQRNEEVEGYEISRGFIYFLFLLRQKILKHICMTARMIQSRGRSRLKECKLSGPKCLRGWEKGNLMHRERLGLWHVQRHFCPCDRREDREQCRYRQVCRFVLGRWEFQTDCLEVTLIQCSCFLKFDTHIICWCYERLKLFKRNKIIRNLILLQILNLVSI